MLNQGFWKNLKRPIYALAPMADVTDAAFRQIISKYGKPDVMFTEFVSVDGLCSDEGRKKLLVDLWFEASQRPIVAQIFGSKPENFYKSARLIQELGFDGIDINMGCPVKKVLNQQSCSALIKNPKLAQEIIFATMDGAGDLPVSVKTRIGFYEPELETWIPNILKTKPAALTLHLRTVKEMSKVPAHWELMPEIKKIVGDKTILLGNGDVSDLDDADQKIKDWGVDGVMIGRGIFGNPWLFNRSVKPGSLSISDKLSVMHEHTLLFEKLFSKIKSFDVMKKHYKAYVTGFDGAKELRTKLFETKSVSEVRALVELYLQPANVN